MIYRVTEPIFTLAMNVRPQRPIRPTLNRSELFPKYLPKIVKELYNFKDSIGGRN